MKQYIILTLSIFYIVSCKNSANIKSDIELQAVESYHLHEIFPSINEMDSLLRKAKELNDQAKTDSLLSKFGIQNESINIGPVFRVYSPTMKIVDGKHYLDSTAILGGVRDTAEFIKYVNQFEYLFPNDIEWKFAPSTVPNVYLLYGKKYNGKSRRISSAYIDSIYVHAPLMKAMKLLEKEDSFSMNRISFKLSPEVLVDLNNSTWIITSNFEKWNVISYNSNDPILEAGFITKDELKVLNKLLTDKIKMID